LVVAVTFVWVRRVLGVRPGLWHPSGDDFSDGTLFL
jgi:hypothetical protein